MAKEVVLWDEGMMWFKSQCLHVYGDSVSFGHGNFITEEFQQTWIFEGVHFSINVSIMWWK